MVVKLSSLRLFYDKTTRGSFLKDLCRLGRVVQSWVKITQG